MAVWSCSLSFSAVLFFLDFIQTEIEFEKEVEEESIGTEESFGTEASAIEEILDELAGLIFHLLPSKEVCSSFLIFIFLLVTKLRYYTTQKMPFFDFFFNFELCLLFWFLFFICWVARS